MMPSLYNGVRGQPHVNQDHNWNSPLNNNEHFTQYGYQQATAPDYINKGIPKAEPKLPLGSTNIPSPQSNTQQPQSTNRNPLSYLRKLSSSNTNSNTNGQTRGASNQASSTHLSAEGAVNSIRHERISSAVQSEEYRTLEKGLLKYPQKSSLKVELIRSVVLTWLKKNDSITTEMLSLKPLEQGRTILLRWWQILLEDLPDVDYADRSVFFEAILGIMNRAEFQDFDNYGNLLELQSQPITHLDALITYRSLAFMTLDFAVDRLNQKGVYSNMISFCAKVLAHAFFKLPDVGNKLVRALPVRKGCLRRIIEEMGGACENADAKLSRSLMVASFPPHLEELCFSSTKSWWRRIEMPDDGIMADTSATGIRIEMTGNWIRRWQSDDSELFFSFYKYYHGLLRDYFEKRGGISIMFHYLPDSEMIQTEADSKPESLAYLYAPGYAHLAAFFLEKIDSLIHREIYSVTTLTPNLNRDSLMVNASALMLNGGGGGGRPKVLEVANKRLSDTIAYIARHHGGMFRDMTNVWFRAVVKRTSLWDAEGVFSLIDFADALCNELESPLKESDKNDEKEATENAPIVFLDIYLDVTYLFRIITLVFTSTDHTIVMMRLLSFLYTHFTQLTRNSDSKRILCIEILLRSDIFDSLFLHWGPMVRAYAMRLLVWRISRVGLNPPIGESDKKARITANATDPSSLLNKALSGEILRLLDRRLESVRKRHDDYVMDEISKVSQSQSNSNNAMDHQLMSNVMPLSSPASDSSSNGSGKMMKEKRRPPPLKSESLVSPKHSPPVGTHQLLGLSPGANGGDKINLMASQNVSSDSLHVPGSSASSNASASQPRIFKSFRKGSRANSNDGLDIRENHSRGSQDSDGKRFRKLKDTFKDAGVRLRRTASSGRFAFINAFRQDRFSYPQSNQSSQSLDEAKAHMQESTVYVYQPYPLAGSNTMDVQGQQPPLHATTSPRHSITKNSFNSSWSTTAGRDARKSKASLDEEAAMAHAARVLEAEKRRDHLSCDYPSTPKSRRESGYWMEEPGSALLLVEGDEQEEREDAERRKNHEYTLSLLEKKPEIGDVSENEMLRILGFPDTSPRKSSVLDPIAEAEAALMGNRENEFGKDDPSPSLPSQSHSRSRSRSSHVHVNARNRLSLGDIGLGKSFFFDVDSLLKAASTENSDIGNITFAEADNFVGDIMSHKPASPPYSESSSAADYLVAPVSQSSLAKRRSVAHLASLTMDAGEDGMAPPSPGFVVPPSPATDMSRMSKHHSSRQSLLPPDAFDYLSTINDAPDVPKIPIQHVNKSKGEKDRKSCNSQIVKMEEKAPMSIQEAFNAKTKESPKLTIGDSDVPLRVGMASMTIDSYPDMPSTPTAYSRQQHIYAKYALVEYEEVVEEYVQWGAECRRQALSTTKGRVDVNEALSALIPPLLVEWPRYFYGG